MKSKGACATTSKYFCSDWIKTDDKGNYLDEYLYNAFCAYDSDICYSGRGDRMEQRGVQVSDGRIVPVGEHTWMSAGTTNSFSKGQNCTWHLVAATPYQNIKTIEINITQSMKGVAGKNEPNTKLRIYEGANLTDILKNGEKTGKTITEKQSTLIFDSSKHILIIASGQDADSFVTFNYRLKDTILWWYPVAGFGAVVLVLSMCVSIAFFFPMKQITANRIAENDLHWQKQANIFCVDMKEAVKEHEAYLTTGNLPPAVE